MESVSFARAAVKQYLQDLQMHPSKTMGQNFLLDANLHKKMVALADVCATDVVIEIGPGLGHLTQFLLNSASAVWCVELDRRLCQFLRQRFGQLPGFRLFEMDVLAGKHELQPVLLENLRSLPASQRFKLIANLPYNIATPVIVNFLELLPAPAVAVVTIQKEVAQRLAAQPGSEHYGYLSIYARFYAEVRIACTLPPGVFYPPPQVHSAIVVIAPHPPRQDVADKNLFYRVVQTAFQGRRKNVANALRRLLPAGESERLQLLQHCCVAPECRSEDLTLEDFIKISNKIYECSK